MQASAAAQARVEALLDETERMDFIQEAAPPRDNIDALRIAAMKSKRRELRGHAMPRKRKRTDGDDSEDEGFIFEEKEGVEYLHEPKGKLSAPAQKAKRKLQNLVTSMFRSLCGVSDGDAWPDPEEKRVNKFGEAYLTPVFDETVEYQANKDIFWSVVNATKKQIMVRTLY